MRLFRKFAAFFACVAFLAGGALAENEQKASASEKSKKSEKTDAGKKKKNGKTSKKGAADEDSGKISLPILKGHDAFGLKIPYFDSEGKLQMLFNIGKASRIDEDQVSMANMQLETYDDEGQPEMTIDLSASVLNLNTRVITTDSHVTIKRSDFEITGRSMEFNTETKRGRLAGDVRMLIYNLAEEPKREKKDGDTPQ